MAEHAGLKRGSFILEKYLAVVSPAILNVDDSIFVQDSY
jgi:hypothetical protein